MNIPPFHSGQPPKAPASPSARGLLKKRAEQKRQEMATAQAAAEALSKKREHSSLLCDERLEDLDSDGENTPPENKPYVDLVRTEQVPVPNDEFGKFKGSATKYYIRKVYGERGYIPPDDYAEAKSSEEMRVMSLYQVIAECLNGRKEADPHLPINRIAKPESGYSNNIQTFVPLMDRFRAALTEDELSELNQILDKCRGLGSLIKENPQAEELLSQYELTTVARLYDKTPLIPDGQFSWDIMD